MLLKVLPTEKISIHNFPSVMFKKGATVLKSFTFRRCLCTLQRSIYKPGPSSLFLSQLLTGSSTWGHRWRLGEDWERKGDATGEGAMGSSATLPHDLLTPSDPAPAWSHIYRLHLMAKCCCLCPNLWLCGSANTQFMMDSQVAVNQVTYDLAFTLC